MFKIYTTREIYYIWSKVLLERNCIFNGVGFEMKFFKITTAVFLASLLFGANTADATKSCESYLRKISDFPDGYRGYLSLPILENMQSWQVKISFTHDVRNFDVPEGDKKRTEPRTLTIVNRPHNGKLKSPGTFRFEYTIHHSRNVKKALKIASVEFGSFRCGAGGGGGVKQPCYEFISVIKKRNDGELFSLRLPILEETNGWSLSITWTRPVKCLTYQGPVRLSSSNGMKMFTYVSKSPEQLKKETMFVRTLDVTYVDSSTPAYINEIRFGKFHCIGYKSV